MISAKKLVEKIVINIKLGVIMFKNAYKLPSFYNVNLPIIYDISFP